MCILSQTNSNEFGDGGDEKVPSDRTLIRRVRDGDDRAAALLYERYANRVFGLVESGLGRVLRSTTEPEDIVQSVFKSVFRTMRSGKIKTPPGMTLWNLIAVIAVNKLKKKARRENAQRRDSKRNLSIDDENIVIESAESVETFQVFVRETLEFLEEKDREILSLRIDGHSVNEISNRTGRSRRTVERSLQRSRIRLANLLLADDSIERSDPDQDSCQTQHPFIYKIVQESEWQVATKAGYYVGSTVDQYDGYIHFSTAEQVQETADKHFSGQSNLLIVSVETAELGSQLMWEPSRSGALFPHLYGALSISAVSNVRPLRLGPSGSHQLPDGFPDQLDG